MREQTPPGEPLATFESSYSPRSVIGMLSAAYILMGIIAVLYQAPEVRGFWFSALLLMLLITIPMVLRAFVVGVSLYAGGLLIRFPRRQRFLPWSEILSIQVIYAGSIEINERGGMYPLTLARNGSLRSSEDFLYEIARQHDFAQDRHPLWGGLALRRR